MCCYQAFSKLVTEQKSNAEDRQAKLNHAKELLQRYQELIARYPSADPLTRKVLRALSNACIEQVEALLDETKI